MNDINLIRYHNRSAHEIHMLLNGEMKDKLFARVVLGESKEGAGISKLALFMTMTASLVCAVFASYVLYHVVLIKDIRIPILNKELIKKKVAEYQLELRTGGDPYLKEGYTRIVAVEQAPDKDAPPIVVVSDYQPPINIETQPELFTKPVELKGEPEKRKRDKRDLITPEVTGTFAIQFTDVNNDDVGKIRTLAGNNDLKLTVLATIRKSSVVWNAYREDRQSAKVIAGKHVRFDKSFSSRKEAVGYLQKGRYGGVVESRTTYYNHYNMEVCCLSDEAAQKLANASGVSTNKIKILKK